MNWIHISLGAALFFSIADLIYKHALDLPSDKFLAYISLHYLLFGLAGVFLFYNNVQQIKSLTNKQISLILFISLLVLFGSLLIWKSKLLSPQPALSRGITSIQIVVLLLVSSLIFKVKTNIYEIIGILLIVSGTLFISFSNKLLRWIKLPI